jgi:hypothetical protein
MFMFAVSKKRLQDQFEDLVKYKQHSKEKCSKLREKLTEEAQDLDMGY